MKNLPTVSVIIPAKDASIYLGHCLGALKQQIFKDFELIVFDNNSIDQTVAIVQKEFPDAQIIRSKENHFVGGAVNRALNKATGKYILVLCADVILDNEFLARSVETCEKDEKIGALQAKVLKFELVNQGVRQGKIIDTTGFLIFKSGRIINRGHGEEDRGQYKEGEIISFEGAAGFFRREALEDAKINGEVYDKDFKWMVEDVDLGWRLKILGWKNYYDPRVVCYHDRKTTKRLSQNRLNFILQRKTIPALKRRLDFQNTILTYIKNMFWQNFFRHFFSILFRQGQLIIYILIFEPSSIPAFWGIMKNIPLIIKKRKWIMKNKKISFQDIENMLK
jgi:GT2 family glycosyltransferase